MTDLQTLIVAALTATVLFGLASGRRGMGRAGEVRTQAGPGGADSCGQRSKMNQRTAEMIRTVYEYVQHEHATSLVKKRLTHDEQAQGRCDVARLIEAAMNEYDDVLAEAGAENRISEFVEAVIARWAMTP